MTVDQISLDTREQIKKRAVKIITTSEKFYEASFCKEGEQPDTIIWAKRDSFDLDVVQKLGVRRVLG